MIIIERRYEHFTREGKMWTDWFKYDTAINEKEAKEKIKNYKEPIKKLKGEYRIKKDE